MNDADDKLFGSVLRNQHRVLQYFLADNPDLVYNLRPRKHNKTLISKTAELSNRFYCECYIVTAISIQLLSHHFIILGCVLLTLFIQIYE